MPMCHCVARTATRKVTTNYYFCNYILDQGWCSVYYYMYK